MQQGSDNSEVEQQEQTQSQPLHRQSFRREGQLPKPNRPYRDGRPPKQTPREEGTPQVVSSYLGRDVEHPKGQIKRAVADCTRLPHGTVIGIQIEMLTGWTDIAEIQIEAKVGS